MKLAPAFLAWVPMVLIAIANGALREAWLTPRFGEWRGRQLSTILLLLLFSGYFAIAFSFWPLASAGQAMALGTAWLVLTLAFEFGLGRFVSHRSWRQLLAEYDLLGGRLWVLVPVWVALAPYVFFRWLSRP